MKLQRHKETEIDPARWSLVPLSSNESVELSEEVCQMLEGAYAMGINVTLDEFKIGKDGYKKECVLLSEIDKRRGKR
jgi:hypothetical protein